jgi:starvation-inducible outer membrane lipoprotein
MPSVLLCKVIASAFVWGLLAGCAAGIPPQLSGQVAWNLGFPEIRRQPEAYIGRVVALGGVVTHIEIGGEGYRLLVSEVSLDGGSRHRPAVNQPPGGMFIVELPRPALSPDLRPGAEITVVGEVRGKGTSASLESGAEVPLLAERYTRIWGSSWWPRFQLGVWGGISI